jgi:hypothetical protein
MQGYVAMLIYRLYTGYIQVIYRLFAMLIYRLFAMLIRYAYSLRLFIGVAVILFIIAAFTRHNCAFATRVVILHNDFVHSSCDRCTLAVANIALSEFSKSRRFIFGILDELGQIPLNFTTDLSVRHPAEYRQSKNPTEFSIQMLLGSCRC